MSGAGPLHPGPVGESTYQLRGSDFVGTPDEIIERSSSSTMLFDHQRFLIYMGNNSIPHSKMMRAVELFGTKVAPVVREEIARRNATG